MVRFVSASVEINHIMVSGHEDKISHVCSWAVIRVDRENDPLRSRTDIRIIASVIVCPTARKASISAYFAPEAQPDHRIE